MSLSSEPAAPMRTTATLAGITLSVAAATDVGLRRDHNEDAVLAQPPILLVADGMGGYESGDRAAQAIVDAFAGSVARGAPTSLEILTRALAAADSGVAAVAAETELGAGATVAGAALVVVDDVPHWVFFNVGDARVYRHLDAELQQVTVDHSLGQELYDSGKISAAEFAVFPERNVVTRAVGATDSRADSWIAPVLHGERILVCSDGLPSELPDEVIRAVLTTSSSAQDAAAGLIALARRAGGRDNISVVLGDVVAGGRLSPAGIVDAGTPAARSKPEAGR